MLKDDIRTKLLAEIEDLTAKQKELSAEGNRLYKDFMGRLEIDGKLRREALVSLKIFGVSGVEEHAAVYSVALDRLRSSEADTRAIDERRWANIDETNAVTQTIKSRQHMLEALETGEVIDLGLGRFEIVQNA